MEVKRFFIPYFLHKGRESHTFYIYSLILFNRNLFLYDLKGNLIKCSSWNSLNKYRQPTQYKTLKYIYLKAPILKWWTLWTKITLADSWNFRVGRGRGDLNWAALPSFPHNGLAVPQNHWSLIPGWITGWRIPC